MGEERTTRWPSSATRRSSPPAGGYITLYPSGATQPVVSNLNYLAGQIIPNAFNVTVGADGAFQIYTPSQSHFIIDLAGYFAP